MIDTVRRSRIWWSRFVVIFEQLAEAACNRESLLLRSLCHGSEDKNRVRELYTDLREDGVNPWLDEREILPGQDWKLEIVTACAKGN